MAQYLTFQIYGPLQAYGTVAVGEIRPTSTMPTRSAVLGILAAAIGIRRDEETRLAELRDGYRVAVREDAPGKVMLDYHTIQTPGARGKRQLHCRRDELLLTEPNTILSRREYLMDALFTVCLWQANHTAPYSLQEIARALRSPRWTIGLGRKSCPPALPFAPKITDHTTPQEAVAAYPADKLVSAGLRSPQVMRMLLDTEGPHTDTETTVRDVPLHHGRRQFAERKVRELLVRKAATDEVPHVDE